jgi:thiol-disulfide isomerase/thioredoxin
MPRFNLLLLLCCLVLFAACDSSAPEPSATVGDSPARAEKTVGQLGKAGIDWFDGSVEEAFAFSQAENRPLFLYWGAVWCPPCVEIRSTVFRSQRFIALSRLFVPVYLDGDTERAQDWGDRFGTKVYPTMIVFSPQGEEVTRLNVGIDISAYNDVLETSLERMRPIRELARTAIAAPSSLSEAEYQQLAYYSWYDDKALPENAPPDFFLRLSAAAAGNNPQAAARLYLQHATVAGGEGRHADPDRVTAILSAPELLFAAWDYLIMPEQILPALAGDEARLDELKTLWAATMRRQRHDERLTVKNQLYGWRPWLVFHFEGDPENSRPLPEDIAEAIRADGAAASASVAGTHSRQSVINTLSNVYMLAGMTADARALLTAEIEKSGTPYYFMGSLAYLEEQSGNQTVAMDWWQRAYEAAEGPATRIRWWTRYVEALTRLEPGATARILDVALYPFEPSRGMEALLSGANFRNLERAANALLQWDDEHHSSSSALEAFREAIGNYCAGVSAASEESGRCDRLLGR